MTNAYLHLVHKPFEPTPWSDTQVPERLFHAARTVFGLTLPVFSVETLADDQRVYRMLQAALHHLAGERKSASHNGNDKEPRDPESFAYLDARGDDEGQGLDSYWKWGFAAGWNDHKKHALGTRAATEVLAERQRQISAEGWTPEHDDEHSDGSMARAAASYALMAASRETSHPGIAKALSEMAAKAWPWDAEWFKPSTPSRDLVKAGALVLAERERLDRADAASRNAAAAPWIA